MTNTPQSLLRAVGSVASGLSPAAKAVVAAVLPLATSLVNMALAGSFNVTSIVVLSCGAVSALAVYFVPNKPKPLVAAASAPAVTVPETSPPPLSGGTP